MWVPLAIPKLDKTRTSVTTLAFQGQKGFEMGMVQGSLK
jgi:hypothetical protein